MRDTGLGCRLLTAGLNMADEKYLIHKLAKRNFSNAKLGLFGGDVSKINTRKLSQLLPVLILIKLVNERDEKVKRTRSRST
ncbi:hypothetical protein ACVXHB_14715 [Escherichia coli]